MDNYVIHRSTNLFTLEGLVNEALKKGHQTVGGVTAYTEVTKSGYTEYVKLYFIQATAKKL